MKRNYFLIGTSFGLIAALGVAAWIMKDAFWDLLSIVPSQKYYGFLPIFVGAAGSLAIGFFADKKFSNAPLLARTLVIPLLIFMTGAVAGSVASWLMNEPSNPFDYFVKPIYWLSLIGAPLSLVVGLSYFGLNKVVQR